jgi:hypothetical protein
MCSASLCDWTAACIQGWPYVPFDGPGTSKYDNQSSDESKDE